MAALLRRVLALVMALKHRKGRITRTQTQRPLSGMRNHPSCLEHQLLHYRLDATALGFVAYRRIRLVQGVLANQAQQIHRHSSKLADQIVGVELARRQSLQIHIGLELRVELLMRGVIAVQRNHFLTTESLRHRSRPAFEHILGQLQGVAMLVDGALCEPLDTPRRVGLIAHTGQFQPFLPEAFALTGALAYPRSASVGRLLRRNGFHRRATRVPFDDEGDLALHGGGVRGDFLHQLGRTKARVCAHQQRRGHQSGGHWQGALKVVFALGCRVLDTRAQCQFQAVAQASQVRSKRAVAINAGVSAPNQFLLGAPVVHGKGIQIHRCVATEQCAEIYRLAIDATAQQQLVYLGCEIEPGSRVGVHALAQCGARWNHTQTECTHEECIAWKALEGIEIAFTQTQQGQIGFEDIRVGRAERTGNFGSIKELTLTRLRYLPIKASPAWELRSWGSFFDNEVGHVRVHLRGESYMRAKLLISMRKSTSSGYEVTDSGCSHGFRLIIIGANMPRPFS
jgi:hypothetical protein